MSELPVHIADQFITVETGKMPPAAALRGAILGLEQKMLAAPEEHLVGLETQHSFGEGTYVRTVFMKAGTLFTGKIHKKEHVSVISAGSASVISEEWGSKKITAPAVFMSPAGVKRLLFIHEDMIWSTVHPNPSNTRDLKQLEAELIAPDFESLEAKE